MKKKILVILLIVIAIGIVALLIINPNGLDINIRKIERVGTGVIKTEVSGITALYKENDKPFKILTFTDLHLDNNKKKGGFTLKYMINNIMKEKPDLIVLNGDNATGAFNKQRAKELSRVLDKLGIYWICIHGNHEGDNSFSSSRSSLTKVFSSAKYSLVPNKKYYTSSGEEVWGNGNQEILILDKDQKIIEALFFLDSGSDISKEDAKKYGVKENSYDYIKESQIQWYKERVNELNGTQSMIFLHIPLPEFNEAYEDAVKKEDGTLDYNKASTNGTVAISGEKNESVCSPKYNSGLFDVILSLGSTNTIIAGHDHVNNYHIKYKGIDLIYNRSSGYSSYNTLTKGVKPTLEQGATLYSIDSAGNVTINDIINRERYDITEAYNLYR